MAKATLSEFYYSAPKHPPRNFSVHSQIIYLRREQGDRVLLLCVFVHVRIYVDVLPGCRKLKKIKLK